MTREEREWLRALAEAATPGPWFPSRGGGVLLGTGEVVAETGPGGDAAFIAAARTDVPALLDEVDRLRGLLACAREEGWHTHHERCAKYTGSSCDCVVGEIEEALR